MITRDVLAVHVGQGIRESKPSSFLLPTAQIAERRVLRAFDQVWRRFVRGMMYARSAFSFASNQRLRFIRRMNSKGPHSEQRTSCVLWPPRILADAQCPQHAWQGFQPVHPTKEGANPLCWILPRQNHGGRHA